MIFGRSVFYGFIVTSVFGCSVANNAGYKHRQLLASAALEQTQVASPWFTHQLFRYKDNAATATAQDELHIYIEGDGTAWKNRFRIASDPTPVDPLMLKAMNTDTSAAFYLTRPCYFQISDPACHPVWWTAARYHNDVVASMADIIAHQAADYKRLVLLGHSGGGTLAVLIGRRLQRPVTVVTFAGNLDVLSWSQYHQYSPLNLSLDPMRDSLRNPAMTEIHWLGLEDSNILPNWTSRYCQVNQVPCRTTHFSHNSGWLEAWQTLLQDSLTQAN